VTLQRQLGDLLGGRARRKPRARCWWFTLADKKTGRHEHCCEYVTKRQANEARDDYVVMGYEVSDVKARY